MVKYNNETPDVENNRTILTKDRSIVIPVETSIEYLKSEGMNSILNIFLEKNIMCILFNLRML